MTACPLVPWNAKLPTPHLIPPRAGTSAAALLCRPNPYRRNSNLKAATENFNHIIVSSAETTGAFNTGF
jgi:hypothetical protein